ncbi:hypothetical protein VPHK567_0262 [Vibrio phage K567]
MTYTEAKASTDLIKTVCAINEEQFYEIISASNAATDFEFSAMFMRAQSNARKQSLINY